MKRAEPRSSIKIPSFARTESAHTRFLHAVILLLALTFLTGAKSQAQSRSDNAGTISGVVINSVTHLGIDRALVSSPDNRFATLTNSEGRFEFKLMQIDSANDSSDSNRPQGPSPAAGSNRPYALMARKPGFLNDSNQPVYSLQNDVSKDVTLVLIPESVIAGTVILPTSESPDSITLQIYRWQVQEGRGRWLPAGNAQSRSDGQFRFAGLAAGTYKLLTTELLDTDPLVYNSRIDPLDSDAHEPLFGYPPVYYPNALDFGSAGIIQLSAGQTQTANLTLVKHPYYRVKLPVVDESEGGLGVNVYTGHRGPGFSLGYNQLHHAVEGMLPSGSYTVEVTSYRPNGSTVTGLQLITIKGAAIKGPSIGLASAGSIAVNVKEEFTSADQNRSMILSHSGRSTQVNSPRRYLNVMLEPADDFGMGRPVSQRRPASSGDEALAIDGAAPGRYWVHVQSSRGYAASIRSGNIDLLHQPLVVEMGGTSPIEITMRDDLVEISGKVDGMIPPMQGPGNVTLSTAPSSVHVYCVPLPDSGGQFTDIWVNSDGSFDSPQLPPGAYRLLAFDRAQTEMEYRNPEAMQAYDSKGTVIRVPGGQKERVTLQLISTSAGNEE
jgi:hypothetical protein